ncbi:MAG: hypothetical protein SCK29_00950 [Bacillota bacterium]|nr:hypothetical protein [Bacillota bacterium]MDW7682668.1 hypothetical protein [Bacillota bacterium]
MARNIYGKTWWGKAWIRALEYIDYSSRLPRGRRYANAGAVTSIEVKNGTITARVQGRRKSPYKITISLTRFHVGETEALKQPIGQKPALAAELSLGRLPESLPDNMTGAWPGIISGFLARDCVGLFLPGLGQSLQTPGGSVSGFGQ